MFKLVQETPWTTQPQQPVKPRPEWNSVYSFGSGNFDLVSQANPFSPIPSGGIYPGFNGGRGLYFGTGDVSTTTGRIVPGITADKLTSVMVVDFLTTTTSGNFIFGESAASVGAYNYGFYERTAGSIVFFVHNGTTGAYAESNYNGSANRGIQIWAATYDGAEIRIYRNGVLQNVATAQTGNVQRNTGAHLSCQRWNSFGTNSRFYAGAVSNRYFSPREIYEKFSTLDRTYDAFFLPSHTVVGIDVPAAGGTTTNRQYSMVFG